MNENNVLEIGVSEDVNLMNKELLDDLWNILQRFSQNETNIKRSFVVGMIIGGGIGAGSLAGGLLITKRIQEHNDKKKFEKMSEEI